jgi:hypothetical protein
MSLKWSVAPKICPVGTRHLVGFPVEIYNQGRIPEYFQTGYSESHKLNIG